MSVIFKENKYVKKTKLIYKDTYKKTPEALKTIFQTLKTEESNVVGHMMNYFDNPRIFDLFVREEDIPRNAKLVPFLIEKRKAAMEKIINNYVQKNITENLEKPEEELETLITMVDNYYDSFYIRKSEDKDLDSFPAIDDAELTKYSVDAYKKIKEKIGLEGIRNDFAKKKNISFAKYCVDMTHKHVSELNDEVIKICAIQDVDVPDKIIYTKGLNKSNVIHLQEKVPGYLFMLQSSYNARSKTERFFSYFPFINPTAKEERRAINKINSLLIDGCRLEFTEEKIRTYTYNAITKSTQYYTEKLSKLEEKLPATKENIIVNANQDDVEIVENVNEIDNQKELDKSNDLLV
jgi:hypothetical protein